MIKLIPFFLILIFSSACLKTAEQVQREKKFETMSEQMGDTQGLMANIVSQMKDLQTQINKMNGRLEELEHRQGQVNPEQFNKMNENINLLKTQQESQSTQLANIQTELKEQRAFIEKVTASLASVKEAPSTKSSKKKNVRDDLDSGLKLVKQNKFEEARRELEGLIDHDELSPGEKNKVLHGLGRVEYFTGNPEKALVYFSKIYTKYPKATLAPSSLLFIGRSLNKLGKKDEAKQAFQKVLEDYKGTKEANEAKHEL
jgi:TolA-binding protein